MSVLTRAGAKVSDWLGRDSRIISTLRPAYEWLLDASSGGRGVEWPVHGEHLRIDPRMRPLVAQSGEPKLFDYLKENIRPGDVILDVGSFLGTYAIFMARWAEPTGKVFAFEPSPESFQALKKHLAINGVEGVVSPFQMALGDKPGAATLKTHTEPYRNALGAVDPKGVSSGEVEVEVSTIDDVCEKLGITPKLIRMDIQGHEYAALRGAEKTLEKGRGHLQIVLEVHPQLWPLVGVDEKSFDALLEEYGLRVEKLHDEFARYVPDGHVALRA